MDGFVVGAAILLALVYIVRKLIVSRWSGQQGCDTCQCSPSVVEKGQKKSAR